MEMFRVLEPGPFTTIQDAGRYGYQQFGIPISGALDMFAFRVANLLVGNTETAAELECTFLGSAARSSIRGHGGCNRRGHACAGQRPGS